MSRYAALEEEEFEPDEPTTPTRHTGLEDVEDTPRRPSQHSTRPPSPTPTLEPLRIPETWSFRETPYASLADAAKAAGRFYGVDDSITEYITSMIQDFTRIEVFSAYNQLGNKMYEHRNQTVADIQGLKENKVGIASFFKQIEDLHGRCKELEDENDKLKAEIQVLKADGDVLNNNHGVLTGVIKRLQAQVNTLAARPAPTHGQVSSSNTQGGSRPKIGDPPKFKGKTREMTVEQWLQKLGIWFRYQNTTTDDDKITTALLFLEGGAQAYMDDYAQKAADGISLGTWDDFVRRLHNGYRELAPEKSAQRALEEHCNKQHPSLAAFAENFLHHAIKSGYSDVELIRRIDDQCKENIRTTVVTQRTMSPYTIPTKWEHYLNWVLSIETEYRGEKFTRHATSSRTTRDPNAMDIDAVRKPEKLSKEQEEWLSKRLCFRCGKHPAKPGVKCRNPVYKGYYEFPKDKTSAPSTRARVMNEEGQDRMEFVINALKEYDQKGKEKAQDQETTARIVELDEQDFLRRM